MNTEPNVMDTLQQNVKIFVSSNFKTSNSMKTNLKSQVLKIPYTVNILT